MKSNKDYQREYRQRMAETHERFILYIPKEDYGKMTELAKTQDWINKTGRKSGEVNLQQAIVEIIKRGLDTYD